jgi:hypothetical protein
MTSSHPARAKSPSDRWRLLLRACRVLREVSKVASAAEAARQFAYQLSSADRTTQLDALSLVAALAAKGNFLCPRVRDVERAWAELALLHTRPTSRRGRRSQSAARDPLPVEAARAVRLGVVAERLGLDLRRRGHEVVARCPFHDDTHPSLRLNASFGLWYCFPCGVGGDVISLFMRVKNLTFAEAVRELGR